MTSAVIFFIGSKAARDDIIRRYGRSFYKNFKAKAKWEYRAILPQVPDIGDSIFKFNYAFTPAYIAWYKAFRTMGLDQACAVELIWKINENMLRLIPSWLLTRYGAKVYLGGFRKKAPQHAMKSAQNTLPEYDYKTRFREIDANAFEIDIYECGMKKLCEKFDASDLFPGVCRIDYLVSHYMGCGFYRTQTLGDGNACCNCRYEMTGSCSWEPEKGFEDRK
ncbi:MAG: L-2-amino-thiazoline-4-carboxylic acid hydrolase [Syntrophomonadaceae bacterium]|nr:L-2-amino-thiazoline-4-carboxylic acid hydrolase [Syntrophomonadaceae bacterium]